MFHNPIVPSVDFEADGVQHGHLRLPYSRDDSAWGSVMIPITVVRNGNGPTALLTGANHGDEYEGPVALFDLARSLKQEDVAGRVIIVPAMNYPAFAAGTRTSPADGGNMNRAFPGRPNGTVTEKIADFFYHSLLPLSDIVLDFHSGGRTLDFVPFAAAHVLNDKVQEQRCVSAMKAFNAPYSAMLLEIDNVGMYDTAAEDMGKVFVSTELGGGGTATARSSGIAKKGLRNLLIHAGILDGDPLIEDTIVIDIPTGDCFTFCEDGGVIEFCVDLGEPVHAGDVVARVWPLNRTGTAPVDYKVQVDGILAGKHFPGLVKPGDCLSMVAVVL